MEACVQNISSHAVRLMTSLNLQREQAQFCDCVVIQRLNPGQVFPAHRCVLSASSPVLASILSTTSVLVELQDPCLSGSVLAMLLDYIYTGSMQYMHSQEQYYNLLTAATYLQMDQLQETLKAWQQPEVDAADNTDDSTGADHQANKHIRDADSTSCNSFRKHVPLLRTCSVKSSQGEELSYAANLGACNEIDPYRSSDENGANFCGLKGNSPLRSVSTGCCAPGNAASAGNTGNCTQVTYLTPQDLIEKIPCIIETHGMSPVDEDLLKDQPCSSGTVKQQTHQGGTEEELVRRVLDRRDLYSAFTAQVQEEEMSVEENMKQLSLAEKSKVEAGSTIKDNVSRSQCTSSSSSLPTHPCCGAVSVICHSSKAPMPELMELSAKLHCPSVFKASGSSWSPSGCTVDDSIVEGITIAHNDCHGARNQEFSHKSNSAIADCERSGNALFHIANQSDHNALNQSKVLADNLLPQNRHCSNLIRGLKTKTDLTFEDSPSKYQRRDCSDSLNVLTESIHSHDLETKVPLPSRNRDTGRDSHCEYLCLEGEVKEEHTYSKRFPNNVQRQATNCDLYRQDTDWCPNVKRAETSTQDYSVDKNTVMTDQKNCVDISVPTTPEVSLGNTADNLSVSEHCTSLELDNNTSDHTSSSVVWQSYHGHLHYHCMPQEDIHITHRDSDHKHSNPEYSDQASDEEEVRTYQDQGTLTQHFARQTTERVVLLDISAKPAELLVTYKHRSEGGEDRVAYDHKGSENNDEVQWEEATPAAVVDERKCTATTKLEAECVEGATTEFLVGEAKVAVRESVKEDRSSPGDEFLYKARATEVGTHTSTFTVCSQPTDSEFVQGPMASTLSDFIPFTPSAITPTNKSAPLSTPAHHPFKCYLCDRSFSQRGSLNRHVRSHLGVRPFPCPNCPMTFSRQYRVTEHMRVHQRCSLGTDFKKPSASPT